MKHKLIILSCFAIFSTSVLAQQNFWTNYNGVTVEAERERNAMPEEFKLLRLNVDGIEQQLLNASAKNQSNGISIKVPNTDGDYDTFIVQEASVMHPDLQAKYPNTKSYAGYAKDNRATTIRFSISPYFGFNAIVRSATDVSYIDSYSQDNKVYIVYSRDSLKEHIHNFSCQHDGEDFYDMTNSMDVDLGANFNGTPDIGEDTVQDGFLRKYRLALATTIEYTAYISQQAGVGNGTDAQKKAAVMDALNLALTRLNEVYERDLSTTMELVPNNDELIFIDSDNYNPLNAGAMLGQNQTTINNIIGNANYDIGHVFFRATQGNDNGVAYLRSVCNNQYKAGGVTGAGNPVGDPFVIDYVAHEMGHQYGANHTQNNSCNRNGATAVEPGSASTIMGYAGICYPNVQNNSDAYFHATSVQEMYSWVTGGGNCGDNVATGNNAPTLENLANKNIPKETPFALVAYAEDEDGDVLTYNFEQTDTQTAQMPPRPTNTGGPMFRTVMPTESNEKFFPRLSTIIEGYDPNFNAPGHYKAWEKLPAVARQMNFAVLVRDNNPAGGQSARRNVRLTVENNAGPFVVTSQASNETWTLDSSQTITWDVANTDSGNVNTPNVTILVSTDGGLTFPHVLVEETPNNGSYTFTVPAGLGETDQARVMVRAVDNYFLNVNSADFTIDSNLGVNDESLSQFAIYPNPSNGMFTIDMDAKSNNVSYSVYNMEGKLIANQNINVFSSKVSQQVNLSHLPAGTYIIKVVDGREVKTSKLIIR